MDPLPIQSYNMTKCCHASGLLPQCMPLCSLDIKMSDIHELGATCQAQMGMLVCLSELNVVIVYA